MRAKKSLGQNFLNSKTVANEIVRAGELVSTDTVLEIGPGKGFLTEGLLASGAHIIAVEKDDRMIPLLSEKFATEIAEKRFTLIHGDIVELLEKGTLMVTPHAPQMRGVDSGFSETYMKLDCEHMEQSRDGRSEGDRVVPTGLFSRKEPVGGEENPQTSATKQRPKSLERLAIRDGSTPVVVGMREELPLHYKLVANIPYYITGYILRAFLEANQKPERMILMLQKEVADRIVARDKKESILSIATKAYGTPRIVKKVPARYFTPAPNVDSAVLAITNISNKNFPGVAFEKRFFEIMKTGFAHKRKQLAGNLKELFGNQTLALLEQAGISPHARAEDISLDQWLALSTTTKSPQ